MKNGKGKRDENNTNGVDSARWTDDAFYRRRDFIGRRVLENGDIGGGASDGS